MVRPDDGASAASPIPVVAWVCIRDNAVLHARTRGQAKFYAPGGKVEAGENDVTALRREVAEELSVILDPASIEVLTVIDAPGHGTVAGRQVRMTCYTGDPMSSSGPPVASAEIAEIAWLGLADEDRCAPADQALLEHLAARGLLT